MIRGIVKSVVQGVIQRFTASGRADEEIADRELFQHYGLTSRPLQGAELIILREGNHYIAVASDDRRYRIALEEGEVALYTDEGDKIHLKRSNEIHVKTGKRMFIESGGVCDITVDGKTTVKSGGTIELDGGSGDTSGVVTKTCKCPFTGHDHSDYSVDVTASKG